MLFTTAAHNYSTSERPKVLRRLQFFNIFTSKCAFRHNIFTSKCAFRQPQRRAMFRYPTFEMWFDSVQLFDIGTSKSAPKTTVFSHFHFQMCFSPQRRRIIRHRNVQKCSEDYSFFTFSLPNALFATAAYNYSTSERPKVFRRLQFFHIFTSTCAFCHSGVQLFDIGTSKSAPKTTVFYHFHWQMCFSPQQRAFFRRMKSKTCFGADVFCAFSLQNVLFATAACIFSTSELTKVLRTRHVLYILTSECAFRHSNVHFFDI